MVTEIHMDFETRSECDLRKAGSDVYSRDPSTRVLCVGLQIGNDSYPVILSPNKVINYVKKKTGKCLSELVVVAHNARFEYDVWRNCCVKYYNWPAPKIKNLKCTMVKAYVVGFPGSLANASAAANMPDRKDDIGKRVMMQLCKPKEYDENDKPIYINDPAKFETLYKYCQQDVVVEVGLDKKLPDLSPHEKKVWELDQKINDRGIRIDLPAVRVANEIVKIEKVRLNEEMKRISGDEINTVTAHIQIKKYINYRFEEAGISPVTSTDKANTDLLLRKLKKAKRFPEIVAVLELKKKGAKSSAAKLSTMLDTVDEKSERIRGIFQYYGAANTGRWSGRKVQPHNFPIPKISKHDIEDVFGVLHGS